MAKTATSSPIQLTVAASEDGKGLEIKRYFTEPGKDPFDLVDWEMRDARIGHGDEIAFEQKGVEFPKSWSQNATNIVAQKYFRGQEGADGRESSVKQMIGRVAGRITEKGDSQGYFATEEDRNTFKSELTHILLNQMASFNSPVWFNVGFARESKEQCSACFILSVDDTMESILNWNTEEGLIFRGGSGSGINLSKIRGSQERLSRAGFASGPVSFMRGTDAWAGTIKCLAEGTEVLTEAGIVPIEDVREGDSVLTRFGPKAVSAAHDNGVKPLVRVTTELGNEIVCTAEHRFLVRDADGETVWREAGNIGANDYLMLDLGQVEFGRLQRLNPVKPGHHNERNLLLPQVLHESFARWLGLIYGDGNITDRPGARYVGIQIDDQDRDLKRSYRDLVAGVFGSEAHIYVNVRQDKPDASSSLRFASTQAVRFLKANGLTKGEAGELKVPDKIKSSPSEVRAAFLSGLFEADGHVDNGYPTLSTVSKDLALDVHRLLLSIGIPSKIRRVDNRNDAYGSRPIFMIRIISLAGIARFQQFVGFISTRKQRKLDQAVKKKSRCCYETDWVLPHAGVELNKLWGEGSPRLRRALSPYCRYSQQRSFSGLRATALLNEFPELSDTVVEQAASTYAYYARAVVEPVGVGPVYDITVEGTHEYLVHNTVTHNSGGTTRRAAKMVVLDIDHPDIKDFIWCKAKEEEKARALSEAGFDMSIGGEGYFSIQYQNANNSVRVTDEFMNAVERNDKWQTIARKTGEPVESHDASELMHEIADAAWRCADPGLQYDTTINDWHTCPNSGRINASNPCSEYMHVDNSACNLSSINLMKFERDEGTFDIDSFKHTVNVMLMAQEIMIDFSSYPTKGVGDNARAFRQLGLGYANLGALLMSRGVPYDSDEGRTVAAAITSLMTGEAYRSSAEFAAAMGPYNKYTENRDPHMNIMRKHRDAAYEIAKPDVGNAEVDESSPDPSNGDTASLIDAARTVWDEAVSAGEKNGYRNSQATVLAPTGTISFMMDCDTTGIEPDFSLVKVKDLAGGGQMVIINSTVPLALHNLGYSDSEIQQIEAHINEHGSIVGAPAIKNEHLPVFDVAVGERAISHMGHVKMMAVVQPFISGAISKTVNMPNESTVEDIQDVYTQGWKLGLKALAIYRDGSKTTQALRTEKSDEEGEEPREADSPSKAEKSSSTPDSTASESNEQRPARRRLPRERQSITHKFQIAGHEGYITAGMYEDGTLGEIFLTDIGKDGSTLRGMMNAFATSISVGLQYGVPLETFVRKFSYMRFDPEGITGNPEIPFAKSLPDYIMRWLASRFLDADAQEELGILTPDVRERKASEESGLLPEQGNGSGNGDTNGSSNDGKNGSQHSSEASSASSAKIESDSADTAHIKPAASAMTDTPPVMPAKLLGGDVGPACSTCGGIMQRTGSCYTCASCGANTGCG